MSAKVAAEIIQTIIAPAVLITVCVIFLNGLLGRYTGVADALHGMARDRLELLQTQGYKQEVGLKQLQKIDTQMPILSRRHNLLQQAVQAAYTAIVIFLFTMFTIAASITLNSTWFSSGALLLFLVGVALLLIAVVFTSQEIRVSHRIICREINATLNACQAFEPAFQRQENSSVR